VKGGWIRSSDANVMLASCIRVIDLETAGNGLGDVCEVGWQDVVL
jgi:exodeoxyribonuclease X